MARYTATPVADRTASAPTQFGEAQRLVEGLPIETQWWQSLDSSAVDGLIDEAFHVSPTLASISANLRQAQELLAAQRRRKIMLLLGAETLGMTHNQCLELLESAEDTLDFLISSLTYLIHAENQQAQPDAALSQSGTPWIRRCSRCSIRCRVRMWKPIGWSSRPVLSATASCARLLIGTWQSS